MGYKRILYKFEFGEFVSFFFLSLSSDVLVLNSLVHS